LGRAGRKHVLRAVPERRGDRRAQRRRPRSGGPSGVTDRLAYVSDESLVEGEIAGLADSIAYEARATWVAAGLVALAVLVFVGQMVARQARREVDDGETVRAMGATTSTFVMVRRQRGQLAVLQALGFRRRQLSATVSWFVTALLVPALVIGVPLGIVAGRWGWRVFAANLGVPSIPVVPLVAVVTIVVAAIVVVNVVAFPLAWRAARGDLAQARRAE
jgi:FtsX-like permease family